VLEQRPTATPAGTVVVTGAPDAHA
jgi:hypothetical protein